MAKNTGDNVCQTCGRHWSDSPENCPECGCVMTAVHEPEPVVEVVSDTVGADTTVVDALPADSYHCSQCNVNHQATSQIGIRHAVLNV